MNQLPDKELLELRKENALLKREMEVERALENVRTKALEMRSSTELSETSTILFQQFKELGISAIRSGVGIIDEDETAIELWITTITKDGQLFFVLDYINVHVHPVFENVILARKQGKEFVFTRLEGAELQSYYKIMSTYRGISDRSGVTFCEFFYSFFFSVGTINLVTTHELTEEEQVIMLRIAKVFGLLYTRFLDLKKSESQAQLINEEKKILEETLDHLKATQTQLVQSEKMASLGELTAGIAHEIQNPLNFVNNFSELNKELIAEMMEEINRGNFNDVKNIAKDISDNEEKINHHGKRADGIVKSMLQHSRSSSGQKELTDINALCDEYLRLAFHGLRAKDKSFNAKFESDFDPSVGKINVVSQDIGRVVLNLINNAFYAVSEKSKLNIPGYEPTVTVSTKKINSHIEIRVADNGNGIPEKVLDKIFQPFFTTKPSGQGTGLGLSLSYDIITKGHGGELKVETKEKEYTEFIIVLPS